MLMIRYGSSGSPGAPAYWYDAPVAITLSPDGEGVTVMLEGLVSTFQLRLAARVAGAKTTRPMAKTNEGSAKRSKLVRTAPPTRCRTTVARWPVLWAPGGQRGFAGVMM